MCIRDSSRRAEGSSAWNVFIVVLWIEWLLLCISILTTKQHYLFDLVTGIAVAQLAWLATKPTLDEIEAMGPSAFAEECGWTD